MSIASVQLGKSVRHGVRTLDVAPATTFTLNVATMPRMAKRGGTDDERRARGDQTRRDLIDAGPEAVRRARATSTPASAIWSTSPASARAARSTTTSKTRPSCSAPCSRRSNGTSPCARSHLHHRAPTRGSDFRAACTGFSSPLSNPKCNAIMLLDGPVVLGWQTLRAIEEGNSIALINEMVREAIAEGVIDEQPVDELTHMLVAALEEASLLVAHAANPGAARAARGEGARPATAQLLGRAPKSTATVIFQCDIQHLWPWWKRPFPNMHIVPLDSDNVPSTFAQGETCIPRT